MEYSRLKKTVDGEIQRYKARLTVRGFSQAHGVDYNGTLTPIVHVETLYLFMTIIVKIRS